jgi:hypothetical protein
MRLSPIPIPVIAGRVSHIPRYVLLKEKLQYVSYDISPQRDVGEVSYLLYSLRD